MTYILLIWTAVACSQYHCKYDWRPIGEFHYSDRNEPSPKTLCEAAATQLALKAPEYRCVRSK